MLADVYRADTAFGRLHVDAILLQAGGSGWGLKAVLTDYRKRAPSSGLTQKTLKVFSYSGNCSRYFSVRVCSMSSL